VWNIELSAVITRSLFVCGALLVFANVAFGDGTYQRTKNGRTIVWNNHPKPGDEATWWGGRDREGYAHGFGAVTWYSAQHERETSSAKPALYASYWGNMVRGKLEGQVNVHSKGETHYAIFTDGVRRTRWAYGPAPSGAMARWRAAAAARQSTVPEPPAVGPVQKVATANPSSGGSEVRGSPSRIRPLPDQRSEVPNRSTAKPSTADRPKIHGDDSLRRWVGPPRSLRRGPVGSPAGVNPAPPANARLTKEEVVDLAEAAARSRGYDLSEYQRAEPQYDPADGAWSLLYGQKPADGTTAIGKHFSVAVEDKTKRTVLVGGK